ncbi:hypothetical protein H4219_002358 [Mycoemilia scoparia]|uniref:BZIP domain-containing protein n=1 Tax=Mycoemilia scoparia TaxID=417184 RepID=A0A9W8DUV6_9FUNG|nr:hypothetical protein H4219_002358 [Mycoemilia scoparia]
MNDHWSNRDQKSRLPTSFNSSNAQCAATNINGAFSASPIQAQVSDNIPNDMAESTNVSPSWSSSSVGDLDLNNLSLMNSNSLSPQPSIPLPWLASLDTLLQCSPNSALDVSKQKQDPSAMAIDEWMLNFVNHDALEASSQQSGATAHTNQMLQQNGITYNLPSGIFGSNNHGFNPKLQYGSIHNNEAMTITADISPPTQDPMSAQLPHLAPRSIASQGQTKTTGTAATDTDTIPAPSTLLSKSSTNHNPKTVTDAAKDSEAKIKVEPGTDAPPITAAQKRQDRLIKNRAAALLSRKRKREHLESLESTVKVLTEENEELKKKVQELEQQLAQETKENSALKIKLATHDNPVKSSSHTESISKNTAKQIWTPPSMHSTVNHKNHRVLGNMLIPVIFSFGIFCLLSNYHHQSSFSSESYSDGGLGFSAYKSLPGTGGDMDEVQSLLYDITNDTRTLTNNDDGSEDELSLLERIRRSINNESKRQDKAADNSKSSVATPSIRNSVFGLQSKYSFEKFISTSSAIRSLFTGYTTAQSSTFITQESAILHSWIQKLMTPFRSKLSGKKKEVSSDHHVTNKGCNDEYGMIYCSDIQHAILKTLPSNQPLPSAASKSASSDSHPRLSFYSPISDNMMDSSKYATPPWETNPPVPNNANTASQPSRLPSLQPNNNQYLRIDVEVLGSRIVTDETYFHDIV